MRTGKRKVKGDLSLKGNLTDENEANPITQAQIKTHIDSTHAPLDAKYLVGESDGDLSAEILTQNINPQNLLLNGNFEYWYAGTSVVPDGYVTPGAGSISRESTIVPDNFNYSAHLINTASNIYLLEAQQPGYLSSVWLDRFDGKTGTLSALVYTDTASRVRLRIRDTEATVYSDYHTGDSTWQLLTLTRTIVATNRFECGIAIDTGTSINAYASGFMLVEGSAPFAYSPHPEDHLYKQTEVSLDYHRVSVGDSDDNFNGVVVNVSGYASCKNVNQYMIFTLPIPIELYGHPIIFDECTIYYNTQANGDYIDSAGIFCLDGDGSNTTIVTHTGDMGNGTSGNESHNIVDTPTEIIAGNCGIGIYLKCAGADLNTDQRIYGMNLKYHVEVHG